MTTYEYKFLQSRKLIDEFKKKYYEKIGHVPTVTIIKDIPHIQLTNHYNLNSLELNDLEEIINDFIPKDEIYINYNTIRAKTRRIKIAELRHIFSHIARSMGYTLQIIAKYLDNRDHTTIMNSIKICTNRLDTEEDFKNLYDEITIAINKKINGNKLLYSSFEESVNSESTLHTVLL